MLISWPLLSSFIIFKVYSMFHSSVMLFWFSICFLISVVLLFTSFFSFHCFIICLWCLVSMTLRALEIFFNGECLLEAWIHYLCSFLSSRETLAFSPALSCSVFFFLQSFHSTSFHLFMFKLKTYLRNSIYSVMNSSSLHSHFVSL